MREFNTEGNIIPKQHYYVDLTPQVNDLMRLIERGKYFVINRPRQFGKTTLLHFSLERLLKNREYLPILINLEVFGQKDISDSEFYNEIMVIMANEIKSKKGKGRLWLDKYFDVRKEREFIEVVRDLCRRTKKKIVLLVDEIDAIPETVVVGFLHSLREMYLERAYKPTFHSVALVGVRDIKSLKVRVRNESQSIGSESPFNIAVDYKLPPFSLENIKQYYQQHTEETGQIFEDGICEKVYQVTSGHPFLVSYLAKAMVEIVVKDRKKNITMSDCESAIQLLLKDRPANFESLYKNASDPKIQPLILDLLTGAHREFNIHDDVIDQGYRFGIFGEIDGRLAIANQIYAQVLYQHFKSELIRLGEDNIPNKNKLVDTTGKLNFKLVLDKFQSFMKSKGASVVKKSDFKEATGQLILLSYLDLLVNGKGWTFKEIHTGEGRIDVLCIYEQQREIVELKIWYGEGSYKEGLEQLAKYLDSEGLNTGYLVMFDRRKKKKYTFSKHTIHKKTIYRWVV